MTVNLQIVEKRLAGDGETKAFNLTQLTYLAKADLVVRYVAPDGTKTDWALGNQYNLTGDGATATGVLTTTAVDAWPVGSTIYVRRATDNIQNQNFVEGNGFPASNVGNGFDRRTLVSQERAAFERRALAVPDYETPVDQTLPAERGGKMLAFDATTKAPVATAFSTGDVQSVIDQAGTLAALVAQATAAAASATQATLQPRILWTGFTANDDTKGAVNRAGLLAALTSCAAIGVLLCLPINAGRIHLSDEVICPSGTGICCEVPGTTWLDWSEAGTAGDYEHASCLYIAGSFTELPGLKTTIGAAGAPGTTLDGAFEGLEKGDVVFAVDKANGHDEEGEYDEELPDNRFNKARKYYYQGEPVKLESATVDVGDDETVLTFQKDMWGSTYLAPSTKINRMNAIRFRLEGVGLRGPANKMVAVYQFYAGRDCVVRDVTVENTKLTAGQWSYCVDCTVEGGSYNKTVADGLTGNSYAVCIANCDNIRVRGIYAISGRHAGTANSWDTDYAITNSYIQFSNCVLLHWAQADTPIQAADLHGNCRKSGFVDCDADGLVLGGHDNYFTGGTLRGGGYFAAQSAATVVFMSELLSVNHVITPNSIEQRGYNTENRDFGTVLNCGWAGHGPNENTVLDGTLVFWPKRVNYRPDAPNGRQRIISLDNYGSTARLRAIIGGDYYCGSIGDADYVDCAIRASEGSNWEMLDMSNVRGQLAWKWADVDNLILDNARLSQVGLCAGDVVTPFGGGYANTILNCARVSAEGFVLEGGRGKPLAVTGITYGNFDGICARDYDGELEFDVFERLSLHPGDLDGLGIDTDGDSGDIVYYAEGVNDGTIDKGSCTWREALFGAARLHVHLNGVDQAAVANATNLIEFSTVAKDTRSWWDAVNKRYTPQRNGRYRVTVVAAADGAAMTQSGNAAVRRNGTVNGWGSLVNGLTACTRFNTIVTYEVDCNGSTDYIDGAVFLPTGATFIKGATSLTYMLIDRVA